MTNEAPDEQELTEEKQWSFFFTMGTLALLEAQNWGLKAQKNIQKYKSKNNQGVVIITGMVVIVVWVEL